MKKSLFTSLVVIPLCVGLLAGWYFGPRTAEAALAAQLPPESIAYLSALATRAKGWTKEDADAFLRDIRNQAKKAQDSSALWSIYDGVACFTIQQLKKEGKSAEMDARIERSISGMITDYLAGRFAGLPEEELAKTVYRKQQQGESNKPLQP